MGISVLGEQRSWTKRTREDKGTAISAGEDILVVELEHESKLTRYNISGQTSMFVEIQERDQDGSNPTTRWSHFLRVPSTASGAEINGKGTFQDPIMNLQAKSEIAFVTGASAGAGKDMQASLTLWEHTG